VRINGVEWRVTLSILIAPMPVSARCIAGHLKLDYGVVKRVVRGLVAWRILERTAGGLRFQPDATRWKSPSSRRLSASNSLRVRLVAKGGSERVDAQNMTA
jgi:hypothetical protein